MAKKEKYRRTTINYQRLANELKKEHEKRISRPAYASIEKIEYTGPELTAAEHKEICCSLLRKGVDSDSCNLSTYYRYVKEAGFTPAHLEALIEKHSGKLFLFNSEMMQFYVNGDYWRIELLEGGRCNLWHNNYCKQLDGERTFTGKFHKHRILGGDSPVNALENILSYKWEEHERM